MKKNKGILMGIAALALLSSIGVTGCESATNGSPSTRGDGGPLLEYLSVSGPSVVTMGKDAGFNAWYGGLEIDPQMGVKWGVIGDKSDEPNTVDGHSLRTTITTAAGNAANGGAPYATLAVDPDEVAEVLTVTATYGGYTAAAYPEVSVKVLKGLKLIKETEIGTTNIQDDGTGAYETTPGHYLVYMVDPKEKVDVRKSEPIETKNVAKMLVNYLDFQI